jgi:hypothetical protein
MNKKRALTGILAAGGVVAMLQLAVIQELRTELDRGVAAQQHPAPTVAVFAPGPDGALAESTETFASSR